MNGLKIFKPLADPLRAVWPTALLALFFSLCSAAGGILLMGTAAYLISAAALHPLIHELSLAIVGVRFFGISRAIFRYAERYVSHDAAFRLLATLRVRFYRMLEKSEFIGLITYRDGDLLNLLVRYVDLLKDFYLRFLLPLGTAALLLLFVSIALFRFSPAGALLFAIGFLGITVCLPIFLYNHGRKDAEIAQQCFETCKNESIDLALGAMELAAYSGTTHMDAPLREAEAALATAAHRTHQTASWTEPGASLLADLTLCGVLLSLCLLVENRTLSGIELAVGALAAQAALESALPVAEIWRHYASQSRAARELGRFETAQAAKEDPTQKQPLRRQSTLFLSLEHITYRYPDGSAGIFDLSLDIHPGARIAIVGANGAGKSTLTELLLAFRPLDSGTISMNGISYDNLFLRDIRTQFQVLTQDSYIFHETIADNLRFADPNASEETLWAALQQVELYDFVQSLPERLHTVPGENANLFSGGQRRRLALARMSLYPAPILLLDEPTAGLDAKTATQLLKTIRQIAADRALILITHDLWQLECMDRIYVLKNGCLAQQGHFRELAATTGEFSRLLRFAPHF